MILKIILAIAKLIHNVNRECETQCIRQCTLERLVLSDRILVTYVPLPATSSESGPAIHVLTGP